MKLNCINIEDTRDKAYYVDDNNWIKLTHIKVKKS